MTLRNVSGLYLPAKVNGIEQHLLFDDVTESDFPGMNITLSHEFSIDVDAVALPFPHSPSAMGLLRKSLIDQEVVYNRERGFDDTQPLAPHYEKRVLRVLSGPLQGMILAYTAFSRVERQGI